MSVELRIQVYNGLDYLVQNAAGMPWSMTPVNVALMFSSAVKEQRGRVFTTSEGGEVMENEDEDILVAEFLPYVNEWFDRYPTLDMWIAYKEMGL